MTEIQNNRCPKCDKQISGEYTTIFGVTYHAACFTCENCDASLLRAFHNNRGRYYCSTCYLTFVPKCARCRQPVGVGKYLRANDYDYHLHCFVCQKCAKQFETDSFYELNKKPYCLEDYWKLKAELQKQEPVEQAPKVSNEQAIKPKPKKT